MDLSSLIDPVLKVSTFVAGVIAIITFRRSVRLKRAEWLYNLHAKFYETPNYKRTRRILDYEPPEELNQLRKCIEEGGDDDLSEALVDYLNFFEFVASLWKLKQLSQREIFMLFEYYLRRINDHQFVVCFIREEGFESLSELLKRVPKDKS